VKAYSLGSRSREESYVPQEREGENATIGRIEEALGLRERERWGTIKRAGVEIQGNYSIGTGCRCVADRKIKIKEKKTKDTQKPKNKG
jgi:hypothetical protein